MYNYSDFAEHYSTGKLAYQVQTNMVYWYFTLVNLTKIKRSGLVPGTGELGEHQRTHEPRKNNCHPVGGHLGQLCTMIQGYQSD